MVNIKNVTLMPSLISYFWPFLWRIEISEVNPNFCFFQHGRKCCRWRTGPKKKRNGKFVLHANRLYIGMAVYICNILFYSKQLFIYLFYGISFLNFYNTGSGCSSEQRPAPSHTRIGVRRHLQRFFAYLCRLRSYTTNAAAYLFSNYFVSLHIDMKILKPSLYTVHLPLRINAIYYYNIIVYYYYIKVVYLLSSPQTHI